MKTICCWLFCVCLLVGSYAGAQIPMLKKAVERINGYENITYAQTERQKSPFTGDWITLKLKASVSHNPQPDSIELYNITDARGYQTVYNGTMKMVLDFTNNTYELSNKSGESPSNSTPQQWARYIQKSLTEVPEKIKSMPDTVINQVPCFHAKIVFSNKPADRYISDLYIHKKTYLPVYIKQYMEGRMGKGDMMSDNITIMINESSYSNYRTNIKNFPAITSFTIPASFKPSKKLELLSVGSKAPNWALQSLQGRAVSGSQLKGKVVLMDFSFNACAACMLSIPTLNRLHDKYKDGGVEIVTVNTSDTKESVARFVKKNNINYPILLNGRQVSKSFQVSAFPTFYLIDKQGNISAVFEGYSKELEGELIAQIDKLK